MPILVTMNETEPQILLTHKAFDIAVDPRIGRIRLYWKGTNRQVNSYIYGSPKLAVEEADRLLNEALEKSKELGG